MTGIIPLKLSMSNAFLLRGERPILMDSGSPNDLPALTRQLAQHGIGLEEIALLIITHAHFDHAGSAAAIQQRAGCPVAAHRLEKDCLAQGQNAAIIPIHPLGKMLMPFMGAGFFPVRADTLIDDTLDLTGYGVDAKVIATPGHTPGSLSVITGDKQAIVGDLIGGGLLLGQFQPGKPRHHYWAVNRDDVQASLKRVFSFQPNKIYVGHGGPLDGPQAQSFFAV
jgi:glyoxylase-like metal-dependent hydrolase (beta-lactamase superfamily II)